MSGILEQLVAALQANTAAVMQFGGSAQAAPTPPAAVDPFAGVQTQVQQPAPPANVTADMITALIQPHVANEAIKTALGGAMRGMGINSLPETQPHQYGELYAKFQAIIASGGAQQQQPASASII